MSDKDTETQREAFERVARELGCDEDESRFDAKLSKIARKGAKPKKGDGEK